MIREKTEHIQQLLSGLVFGFNSSACGSLVWVDTNGFTDSENIQCLLSSLIVVSHLIPVRAQPELHRRARQQLMVDRDVMILNEKNDASHRRTIHNFLMMHDACWSGVYFDC